jgi:hypothetical protein
LAIPLVVNGQVFEYPENFDEGWGIDATGWAVAVTAGMLSLSGGNFPLTSQVNFGTSSGMKVLSIVTQTANPSSSGFIALSKTDTIGFRNNANTGNLLLGIDSSNNLTFNGSPLGLTALTNTHIYVGNVSNVPTDVSVSGDATMANTGALTIANGAITDAKVSAGAAIQLFKLATQAANLALGTDAFGRITTVGTTTTELDYLVGVTGPIQAQLSTYLPLAGGTMSGPISMASHKITSLAFGTVSGDAAAFGQIPVITAGQIVGTATNDNATAGNVGEYVSMLAAGSFASSTTDQLIIVLTLTAGDWDISAIAYISATVGFSGAYMHANKTGESLVNGFNLIAIPGISGFQNSGCISAHRESLATTANIEMWMNGIYSGSTPTYNISLSARRVR